MIMDDQHTGDRNVERLTAAIESLRERIDSLPSGQASPGLTTDDYRELMETRVRKGVISSVFRSSLLFMVLMAAFIAAGAWLWLDREFRSLANEIREQEVPRALRQQIGERLNTVVEEKAREVSEGFREEVTKARRNQADQYLSSNSKFLQIQGLKFLRESGETDAVGRILRFMREKGSLSPLSPELREANFDYGVQALLALGSEEAQGALRQIIADPGYASGVRADATRAAAILKDRKALPALRAALGDTDPDVRRASIEAVERMEARESWPYLVRILSEGRYPKDFPRVIAALRKLGVTQASEAVVAIVERTAKDPADLPQHRKTHLEGITYFRAMKTETALPILFDFLMHPNPEVRLQAVAAVRELAASNLGTLEEWKTKDAEWRAAKVAEWRERAIAAGKLKPRAESEDVAAPKEPLLPSGASSPVSEESKSKAPAAAFSPVPGTGVTHSSTERPIEKREGLTEGTESDDFPSGMSVQPAVIPPGSFPPETGEASPPESRSNP